MFLVAGHETTANTTSFSFALLATYPEIQEKIFEESSRVFEGVDPSDYYSKFNELKYTRAVLEETLRMYPSVVSVPKWTIAETQLGDYVIPERVQISLSVWGLHHNEKIWENSTQFDP